MCYLVYNRKSKMLKKGGLLLFALIIIVSYIDCSHSSGNDSEIILVHVIFRHGERTPSRFYPKDPHRNETFYPIGLGGLTNRGKLMMFRLGQILRSMYNSLLGEEYQEDKVYVRSRFVTRTKTSALLLLAGMWPPSDKEKWHSTLDWQPIPIESKSKGEEDLLNPVCTTLVEELNSYYKNATIAETYIKPYKSFFNYAEEHSGLKINDFRDIARLYFTLKTEEDNGLKLPEWTKTIYPNPLHEFASFLYVYRNLQPKFQVMNSGYLMKKIMDDTSAKINNTISPADRRVFLYSAHETTLGYLLYNLKVFQLEVPAYSNAILLELHKKMNGYFIKVRYLKTPLNPTIEDLTIPNCDTLCPVQRFFELQGESGYLPNGSFKENCK